MTNAWKGFNPAKHKRALFAVLLVGLSIAFYGWYVDPTNGMFHSYVPIYNGFDQPVARQCVAPCTGVINVGSQQNLFLDDFHQANVAQWNTINRGTNCASVFNSGVFGVNTLLLENNSTCNSWALTKGLMDLSTTANREFIFRLAFTLQNAVTYNNGWGIYFTRNATMPNTITTNYSPFADPQVSMIERFSNTVDMSIYIQKDPTKSINQEGFISSCPAAVRVEDLFMCQNGLHSWAVSGIISYVDTVLNYTGNTNGANPGSYTEQNVNGACSPCASQRNSADSPIDFNPQTKYYVGVWSDVNNGFVGVTTVFLAMATAWNPPANAPAIDIGGFFGPIVKALINIGVYMLNALLGFVNFIAPAIQLALGFMEQQVTNFLNFIGNALGFGNVGTDLANFLTAVINFFINQLPQYIGNFPSYITNFLSLLSIEFPFLAPVFTIANAILAFGVAGIAEAIVIFTIGLQMFLFGYGTLMVAAYFFYVGDDGIGGFFTYLGTLEALSFKILNIIAAVTNLGLDILVHVISLIPKPFIQMGAGHLPRLPTVESSASISFPKLDFAEARNGNLIVYWLWCMGLWFLAWFESRNPSLPGSIGALDPAVASNIRQLASFIPILQAATLVSGGLVLIWFTMLPLRLAGIDVTEAPVGAALGRLTGPGPGGVSVHAGKKHLIGKAKKIQQQIEAGKESKVKKKQEAKEAIEKRKKELEEKKRSEELRKEELARKPTGKDLQGPNLQ